MNTKLNTFHLKLLAAFFMVLDHFAVYLVPSTSPNYFTMRIIGRIAAPLFWFCFTEGFRHTSDKLKYICRLGISAGIMGIMNGVLSYFLDLPSTFSAFQPNMFLTMLFMAVAIWLIERILTAKNGAGAVVYLSLSTIVCVLAGFICEYSWIAVGSILCFYFIKHKIWKLVLFSIFSIVMCLLEPNYIQLFMVMSIIPITFYSNEKPKRSCKWFFYIFYPVHIWGLILISYFI